MGESNFVADYVRKHPDILKHTAALQNAIESLKPELFNAFWVKVAEHLNAQDIIIDAKRMVWLTRSYSQSEVEHPGSPFGDQGELKKAVVFYEPNHPSPVYIALGLHEVRNSWSSMLKGKVARLEEALKIYFNEEVRGQTWWCAEVAIPHPDFNSGDAIYDFLKEKDKDGSQMQAHAAKAANKVSKYIEVAEKTWREM
jgi:hypothetical protein